MKALPIQAFRYWRFQRVLGALSWSVLLVILTGCAHKKNPASSNPNIQLESFEAAWSRIGETYYDPEMNGLDWVALHEQLQDDARKAQTNAELRVVLKNLLEPLGESHFAIIPAEIYSPPTQAVPEPIEETPEDPVESGPFHGSLGLKIDFNGEETIVREVDPNSDAYAQGLRVGSKLVSVNDTALAQRVAQLRDNLSDERALEFHGTRLVLSLLNVENQAPIRLAVETPAGEAIDLNLKPHAVSGTPNKMGMLPEFLTVYESKLIANNQIGFVRFTEWAPPIVERFTESVAQFKAAGISKGLIIDLRENPGGVAAMSMGVAGHLVKKRGQSLGVMQDKSMTLNLRVFPRPRSQRWEGPVVVLINGLSASTSEIFAAGMQDIGEATVIGSQSAGMALASMIEVLPNGDRLQFVIWNLTRTNGERVEGAGVTPDIVVHPTPADFQAGNDPTLQAALNFLLSDNQEETE